MPCSMQASRPFSVGDLRPHRSAKSSSAPACPRDARDRLQQGSPRAIDRLRAYFADHAAAFEQACFSGGCLLGVLGLELAASDPAVSARIKAEIERWAAALAVAIDDAKAAGDVGASQPSLMLARVLISAWEGALIRMRLERDAAPLREFQTSVLDAVLMAI